MFAQPQEAKFQHDEKILVCPYTGKSVVFFSQNTYFPLSILNISQLSDFLFGQA